MILGELRRRYCWRAVPGVQRYVVKAEKPKRRGCSSVMSHPGERLRLEGSCDRCGLVGREVRCRSPIMAENRTRNLWKRLTDDANGTREKTLASMPAATRVENFSLPFHLTLESRSPPGPSVPQAHPEHHLPGTGAAISSHIAYKFGQYSTTEYLEPVHNLL